MKLNATHRKYQRVLTIKDKQTQLNFCENLKSKDNSLWILSNVNGKSQYFFHIFLLEFRSRLLLPACELVLFSIGSNCSLRLHYRANFLTKQATMGSKSLFRHIWILILLVNASSKDLWTQCESPSCSRAKEKWHDIDHVLAQLSRLTDVGKKHTGPSTEFFKIVEFQAKNLKIIFIALMKKQFFFIA